MTHMPSGHRPSPPANTIRVAMSGVYNTSPWTNVFYLHETDDGTQTSADLKTVVDGAVNAFHTRMTAQLSSIVTQNAVQATWITSPGNAIEYVGSYSNVFTGGGAVPNAASCIVLNWAINQYYRGGHPRMYLPGPITGNVSNYTTLTSAYQSAIATAAGNWLTDCNALTGTHISAIALGTVSFARGNSWRSPPVFYGYKSANARAIMGTQRRRLGGR